MREDKGAPDDGSKVECGNMTDGKRSLSGNVKKRPANKDVSEEEVSQQHVKVKAAWRECLECIRACYLGIRNMKCEAA